MFLQRIDRWSLMRSFLLVVILVPCAFAQSTELVSLSTAGVPGNGHSTEPVIAADARFVAFTSAATNLVGGDTNWWTDVFVHDRQLRTTEMVSVALGGVPADGHSAGPSISGDGRFIAFFSKATNLVAGDTNGTDDIFVRDRVAGVTTRVSVAQDGSQAVGLSGDPMISANGRFVVFWSWAENLVPGDSNHEPDIFTHDLITASTELISVSTAGAQANSNSIWPSISADGRMVAFQTSATNLAPNTATVYSDLIVRDRQLGITSLINVAIDGMAANANSYLPIVSPDGRWVVFNSSANNLVTNDTNFWTDAFVRDLSNGTTELVSLSSGGTQVDDHCGGGAISLDGRFVLLGTWSANLVLGDTNTASDAFMRDRLHGTTERVSLDGNGGQGQYHSGAGSMTPDSRFVAIESQSVLAAADTNLVRDAYVRDRGLPSSPELCLGDGSATPCPCGVGLEGRGCPNSVDAHGARLAVNGASDTSADTLLLIGSGMPDSVALYFQGTGAVGSGAGSVFGDGLRCAGGTITRIATRFNFGGVSQYPEPGDLPVSVSGWIGGPCLRTYQIWYRDAATYCTASTFNLSNGRVVTWMP